MSRDGLCQAPEYSSFGLLRPPYCLALAAVGHRAKRGCTIVLGYLEGGPCAKLSTLPLVQPHKSQPPPFHFVVIHNTLIHRLLNPLHDTLSKRPLPEIEPAHTSWCVRPTHCGRFTATSPLFTCTLSYNMRLSSQRPSRPMARYLHLLTHFGREGLLFASP